MIEQIRIFELTDKGSRWTGIMLSERVQILSYLAQYSADNPNKTYFAAVVQLRTEVIDNRLRDTATISKYIAYALDGRAQVR